MALNGFGLWVAMMIGADRRELRLPDRAARAAEGGVGARRFRSGAADARRTACTPGATRGSDGASSSLVVLTLLSMLVGFVVAALGAWRLHRARACGPASAARPACPRAGAPARRPQGAPQADRRRARRAAMARAGAERRRRPGRDARAATARMCHGAQGMSEAERAEPGGPVPGSGHQAAARLQARRPYPVPSCRRCRATSRTATSTTSRPTTTRCPRRARRRRPTTKLAPALVRVGDPMRNIAPCIVMSRRRSTRSSARRGSKACPRSIWSPS